MELWKSLMKIRHFKTLDLEVNYEEKYTVNGSELNRCYVDCNLRR